MDAPENTLAAFHAAWQLGVEAVELDVRLTRDGVVVVIHDDSTRRVAGVDRAVADQTLAELAELDVGRWRGSAFAGERIPTLTEVLATVPAGGTVFVEIKTGADTAPAVAAVIRAADPRPRGGHVALQAFDPDALAALAGAVDWAPAYWTVGPPEVDGVMMPYPLALIDDVRTRGFAGLALDHRAVGDDFIRAARAAGIALDVWTINDPGELSAWLARDVRFIETDQPAWVELRSGTRAPAAR